MIILQRGVEQVAGYFPTLVAGVFVMLLGVVCAWLVLQVTIRLCIMLRMDRVLFGLGLRHMFDKADIRYTLYQTLGLLFALPLFLMFLNNALLIWRLTALSEFIHVMVLFLPRLALGLLIAGLGYLIADLVSISIGNTLRAEGLQQAGLLTNLIRWVLLAFFFSMALSQLSIARYVVLIAFSIAMGSFGLAFVIAVGLGSRKAVERAWERYFGGD